MLPERHDQHYRSVDIGAFHSATVLPPSSVRCGRRQTLPPARRAFPGSTRHDDRHQRPGRVHLVAAVACGQDLGCGRPRNVGGGWVLFEHRGGDCAFHELDDLTCDELRVGNAALGH